jgi:hypothetical protein
MNKPLIFLQLNKHKLINNLIKIKVIIINSNKNINKMNYLIVYHYQIYKNLIKN